MRSHNDPVGLMLTGSVEDGLLTDLLQLLSVNQKTGRFSLFVKDGKEQYDLFFNGGQIFHALAGEVDHRVPPG